MTDLLTIDNAIFYLEGMSYTDIEHILTEDKNLYFLATDEDTGELHDIEFEPITYDRICVSVKKFGTNDNYKILEILED